MALNNHVENFTLDMAPGGIAPVLNVSQGDTGRAYTADMYWGGASYDVSGLTVRLRGRKRDNTVFDYALPAPSGTKVAFDLKDKEQVTIIPGNVECELVFTDSNSRVVGTANFMIIVEEAPYDPDAPSESVVQGLVDLIEETVGGDISDEVDAWLDAHPEATTTVQDGAITYEKLNTPLQTKTTRIITTYNEFVAAMEDGSKNTSYVCGNIEITAPITLTDGTQAAFKSFSNAVFVLNSDMFTWSPIGNYYNIPNFTDCTFIGNGHNIVTEGAYVLNGKFVNCNFIDCGIVKNGVFAQSQHFVNCRFANPAGHDLIHSKIVYEARFVACQAESDNKAKIVNAFDTTANSITTSQILFIGGVYEAQTDNIVCMHDGQAYFVSVYTEANSAPSIKVLPTNRTANGILKIDVQDCKINPASGVYFTDIDASFEGSVWASFACRNCTVAQGALVNTDNLWYFKIENVDVNSDGSILPSYESSKVYPVKNSIVDFSAQTGHVIVKKFPCLITFDSSDGGWHTNLYFVSMSYGNRPQVQCLSDPTKTPTITYDAETGFCDVTLHAARGVYGNSSAVLLTGLENNLTGNNYWIPNGGYNA